METRSQAEFNSEQSEESLINKSKWFIYIIECRDKKLYTGITNNLEIRLKQHNSGNGCRFTKFRHPVKLLYSEVVLSRESALSREKDIKKLSRDKKLCLISVNKTIV